MPRSRSEGISCRAVNRFLSYCFVAALVLQFTLPYILPDGLDSSPRGLLLRDIRSVTSTDQVLSTSEAAVSVSEKLAISDEKYNELVRQRPFFSKSSPELEAKIEAVRARHATLLEQHAGLKTLEELVKSHERALTPLFSSTALREIQQVFKESQISHFHTSLELRAWTAVLDRFLSRSSDREHSLVGEIVSFFLIEVPVGSVLVLVDTLMRVPWYIREYELYDAHPLYYASAAQAAVDAAENKALTSWSGERSVAGLSVAVPIVASLPPPVPTFFAAGWLGTLKAFAFWLLVATHLTFTTICLMVVSWCVPLVVGAIVFLCIFLTKQKRD